MDKAGPQRDLPEHDEMIDRVAEGRPEGICTPTYRDVAMKLLDQGYKPVPVTPKSKRVPAPSWTTVRIDEAQVADWVRRFGHCGVGLRTGHLVAIDIDILDPDLAHQATEIVTARLGATLMRVGRWPKRLLLYRTLTPGPKQTVGKVEVLGLGQQFVAFGIHPDTGHPYDWPSGESPLGLAVEALPLVGETAIEAVLAELQSIAGPGPSGSRPGGGGGGRGGDISRDGDRLVTDGRDNWLSTIAFHALHDALCRGENLDEAALGQVVWTRFAETTDLSRPKQDGRQAYGTHDAQRKVRVKLRLLRDGCLPERKRPAVEPDYVPPGLDAATARQDIDQFLIDAIEAVAGWHRSGGIDAAPRIGLRATVGLGKSTAARRHVAELMGKLAAAGLPHRILNLVPSLALADETAAAWAKLGVNAVALRGYEALSRVTRDPMCRDLAAVRAAVAARLDIQSSACARSGTQQCRAFVTCAKQANRRAVAEAEVVVAAYDAMFTGFAGDTRDFALLIIDEACWSRSFEVAEGLTVEALPYLGISGVSGARKQDQAGAGRADLIAARQRLSAALLSMPAGEVVVDALTLQGIDATFCNEAIATEYAVLPVVQLSPGQGVTERKAALESSARRALEFQIIDLWAALSPLVAGDEAAVGKIWLGGMGKDGQRQIRMYRRKQIASELSRLPLLHLDATLRPELASVVLRGLQMVTVDASAPHQHIRLISGSFGKSTLIQDSRASANENQRRANRLRECVEYVRWHALRHKGGRTLVITYLAAEAAFAGIPGVETAHYNAVAGLDGWGDVSALFLVGRPLPGSADLHELTGAFFDRSVSGQYSAVDVGVVVNGRPSSAIRAIRHTDPSAETLRAAICDDEVMQALGRGRGVNRTPETPLEVHVMADVVLPIAHDRVMGWEMVCPDLVQHMLFSGVAVSSPKHASLLYPSVFATDEQARKAFSRGGFKGHFPIRDIYREMSLKSASYRLGGRGQGRETAWWIEEIESNARARLEAAVGPISEWVEK